MATFTRNAWVTGETITADGLNGTKHAILEVQTDDFGDGVPVPSFEIEIPTDLASETIANTFELICHFPENMDGPHTVVDASPYVTVWDGAGYYQITFRDSLMCYYYPETGILTTTEPDLDGGGDDGGGIS